MWIFIQLNLGILAATAYAVLIDQALAEHTTEGVGALIALTGITLLLWLRPGRKHRNQEA